MTLRNLSAAVVLVAAGLITGCGGNNKGATVSGTVTFNGQPLENGSVSFMPWDNKGPPVGGTVTNGKFSVSNVPIGKCRVAVASSLGGATPGGMGESVAAAKEKEKNKDKGPTEITPTDEGNNKEVDVPAGGTTVEIAIRSAGKK